MFSKEKKSFVAVCVHYWLQTAIQNDETQCTIQLSVLRRCQRNKRIEKDTKQASIYTTFQLEVQTEACFDIPLRFDAYFEACFEA